MQPRIDITTLTGETSTIEALSDLLVETVAAGGSVSFMHPLPPAEAADFWQGWLAAAARGERLVLGAWIGGALAGTLSLVLDGPPGQRHRAEIAKLMTRVSHRGRGVARALMIAAEAAANERGRTLLNLDTAVEDGAAGLYEGLGFERAGVLPDYALKPHGGLTGTILYWKRIGGPPAG